MIHLMKTFRLWYLVKSDHSINYSNYVPIHGDLLFFQAAVVSVLLYGCTTWILKKNIMKKQDRKCIRMLQSILNKSWKQHSTKQRWYCHQQPLPKTIQIRQTKHVGHCWRNKDKFLSDILQWTFLHGHASIGQPTRTFSQQHCTQTQVWKTY